MAPCAACKGSGVFRPAPPDCPACKGSGKTERRAWVVDVHIHAGTLDGAVVQAGDIRLRSGQAQAPRRFSFTVQLEKHPLFQLDHDRLSVGVPVSLWRWSLGGDVTVPTLDGSVRVSLPAKPTAMLVKNRGWPEAFAPHRRKPLFVLPRIIYPERLDAHERNLLQMLDARDQLPEVAGWKRHVQAWVEASAADTGL
jgi:molecular chaperone DnaJ